METLEKPNKKSLETKEKEIQYHFEEMAEIEPAAIELVKQLKEKIENGEYDALISDDAGGRIPTLLLRKIFREITPDKKIGTLFVAAGHSLPNRGNYDRLDNPNFEFEDDKVEDGNITNKKIGTDYQKLLDYLKKFKEQNKVTKPLLVTQFIRRGASIGALSYALHDVGIQADIAALEIAFEDDFWHYISPGTKVFYAPKDRLARKGRSLKISEEHEKLSGVEKTKGEYSPIPLATRKREHPSVPYSEFANLAQQLEKKYYGDKYNEYYERVFERSDEIEEKIRQDMSKILDRPITPQDIQKIQKDINLAREDVDLMAKKVIDKVWEKDLVKD